MAWMEMMFAFRCTRKLIKRLGVPIETDPPAPTNLLGDWYANIFFTRHHRLIILVSERTLLPVFMPIRERKNLLPRFRDRLEELLIRLGIDAKNVSVELGRMQESTVAKTASPSVLGSMNDFSKSARVYFDMHDEVSLLDLELWIADTPCSPLGSPHGYGYPDKLTVELLSNPIDE